MRFLLVFIRRCNTAAVSAQPKIVIFSKNNFFSNSFSLLLLFSSFVGNGLFPYCAQFQLLKFHKSSRRLRLFLDFVSGLPQASRLGSDFCYCFRPSQLLLSASFLFLPKYVVVFLNRKFTPLPITLQCPRFVEILSHTFLLPQKIFLA